ncbi:MAG: undecaprenyldiphospho-muramoylpentapeptide beta-N-acetylglucosaminyltransferase [Lachnospirales bacterium]
MKKIVLTGGGTAGHVTPNIALIPKLIDKGFEIHYIGSINGFEKKLVEDISQKYDVKYYGISSGKLRRQLSFKNVTDAFSVLKGMKDAYFLLKKIKPNVIFSKGGYVVVPVVLSAKLLKIPVIIHESDYSPGLANKIAIPSSKIVCTTFESTKKYIKDKKVVCTGSPIRNEVLQGDSIRGKNLCDFKEDKPVILQMGGSQGSMALNKALRDTLTLGLLKNYNIIHLTGKGNLDNSLKFDNYKQFEYVKDEYPHLLAYSDFVISRGGANSIFEFLSIKKPNIIIPLTLKASRGDQIQNAKEFLEKGYSSVLFEEDLTSDTLFEKIQELSDNKDTYIKNMNTYSKLDTLDQITSLLVENAL